MGYQVGCNTLYPHGRLPQAAEAFDLGSHRQALGIIRDAGLNGCEFSHFQHLNAAEQEKLRELCACMGLTPWSAHSWVPLPAAPDQVAAAWPGLLSSLDGAARLGVQVMVLHAAGARPTHDKARAEAIKRSLSDLAPRAVRAGITLAIENCADRTDLKFLIETVDALGLPGVGFNVDTGHAVLRGMAPEETIRLMGARLVTTHLQDNHGERDDHLPPGRGTIAWPAVRDALLEVGYNGMLMVEISDCPPGREPDAVADTRAAAQFIRGLFGTDATP